MSQSPVLQKGRKETAFCGRYNTNIGAAIVFTLYTKWIKGGVSALLDFGGDSGLRGGSSHSPALGRLVPPGDSGRGQPHTSHEFDVYLRVYGLDFKA